MKKRRKSWGIGTCVALGLLLIPSVSYGQSNEMKVDFSESTSRAMQKVVVLPEKSVVKNATVDNGNVAYSQSGKNVTVSVSDGNAYRNEYNPYKYAQYETSSRTSSVNSFANTLSYNSGGFTGTLSKNGSSYVSSGSYIPSDTKYVTGQTSSYYNSGGYSGYLSSYLYSGSYTPSDSKSISNYVGYTQSGYCDTRMGGDWMHCYPKPDKPSTYNYSSGGYSGTLTSSGYNYDSTPAYPSGNGHYRFDYSRTWYYSGTITKPGSDTRVYRYQGNVSRPESDTRMYKQEYGGMVYQGGYDTTYRYSVTLEYVLDNTPPRADVTQTPIYWTNGNVTIQLSNIQDVGGAGMKQVVLPNGVVTTQSTISYTATSNQAYDFTLEDEVGNIEVKRVVVGNIDKEAPSGLLKAENTKWTNTSYRLLLENIRDTGGSGVKQVRFPDNHWQSVKEGDSLNYRIDSNGVYTFLIQDNAGNETVKSIQVDNIDKVSPTGSISYIPGNENQGLRMNVNAFDEDSGVESIQSPDGKVTLGGGASFRTSIPGSYDFIVRDRAGNLATLKGVAKAPIFTVKQDGMNYVISVTKQYTGTPVIEREETKEIFKTTNTSYPISKNDDYSFSVNDGGVWSTPITNSIENFHELQAPRISILYNKNWTNQKSVLLNVKVESLINRPIKTVWLPTNQPTNVTTFNYTVTENGMYTFKAMDADGNYGYASAIINNIDTKTPSIEMLTPNGWVTKDPELTINVNND